LGLRVLRLRSSAEGDVTGEKQKGRDQSKKNRLSGACHD
jgi:hypothetical protein